MSIGFVFIYDTVLKSAGVNEAHFLVFDDNECDVFIETYDVDAFVIFCDVINVILVGGVGFYFECGAVIHEGADDVL